MRITKVLPNQSLPDIVAANYGSMEAGMQFAHANDISLSYIPPVGTEFILPDVELEHTDAAALSYFSQNQVTIGTRGEVPALSCSIVLKPLMQVVPNVVGNPHVIGYYSYDLVARPEFIHVNPLTVSYTGTNPIRYQTEERWILGYPYENADQLTAMPMADKSIPYKFPWTVGLGYMMVWSDLAAGTKTVTFKDSFGNAAYVSPVVMLDNLTQMLIEYLIADVSMEVVGQSGESVIVRIIRQHPGIFLNDYRNHVMTWLGAAAAGEPDPDDPGNENKVLVTLGPGSHTVGVQTSYIMTGVTVFPSSAMTMVIRVA